MIRLHLSPAQKEYDVCIGHGLLTNAGELFAAHGYARVLLVTDDNVAPLYADCVLKAARGKGIACEVCILPAGEASKSEEKLFAIYRALVALGATRTDAVAALGGGVVGDVAGFAAATYMRGTGFVQLPTTLLAQVDSSVGGKVAINLPEAKNIVGAFYQPDAVLADLDTLNTLPARQLSAGMAEVIKYAAIADASLIGEIEAHNLPELVRRSCEIKAQYVEQDPMDRGVRMQLNFGHTLAHALEITSNFSLLHGEAVAAGMVVAARMGELLGVTPTGTHETIARLNARYSLPTGAEGYAPATLANLITLDKKADAEGVRMVLLERMGRAVLHRLPVKQIESLLEKVL